MVSPVNAEKPPAGLQLVPQKKKPTSEIDHKMTVARQLIRQRNYEGAAALLETIYEKQPDNPVVINLLRNCYDQIGQYGKSELLIRRLIERTPTSYAYRMYLAEALARQGQHDAAATAYNEAIERIRNKDTVQYLHIIKSMQAHGFDTEAIDIIQQLRTEKADTALFAFEAGVIYEGERKYREAAGEFYVAMRDTSRVGVNAENKLITLLNFPESSKEVEQTLLELLQHDPQADGARVLSAYYLSVNRTDDALKYALLRDSLEGGNGDYLMQHLRMCQSRKMYKQAMEVARLIINKYGDKPVFSGAFFIYADVLTQLGRYNEAITVYDSIITTFPSTQDKAEAGYQIGNIYLNYLYDYPAALTMFDSVVNSYPRGMGYMNSILAIPHCYLRQDKLDEARKQFARLAGKRLNVDAKEEVDYYLALIDFFENKFDTCKVGLNKLLVDYPRGFYVNDALRLLMIIEQSAEQPGILQQYARARFFLEKRQVDSSIAALQTVAADSGSVLGDVALYMMADMYLKQFDSALALEMVNKLSNMYPDSYYLPYGLKMKADMMLTKPENLEEGKSIYKILLEKYPNYPFISEVRKRLRELELDAHTG